MTTLIVLGNTNKYTFANSIIAANCESKEKFGEPLRNIFIVHSQQSYRTLHKELDWLEYLQQNEIQTETLTHRVLEIESSTESIHRFVDFIETVIKGQHEDKTVLVDLTNGTTLHKTFLSIIAYILDLSHLYMIDIVKLSSLTKDRGFLPIDILSKSYTPTPESSRLDKIAYLNLAEIFRYKQIIEHHTKRYAAIDPETADDEFFRDNLVHSIQLKLQGDRKTETDRAVYRIASSALSASVEDLIRLLIDKFDLFDTQNNTFGQNLKRLESRVEQNIPPDFDLEFFKRFNEFILYLRNTTTHKGKLLTDVEKFKAELSVKMAFPFIEFYTDVLHKILVNNQQIREPKRIRRLKHLDISPDAIMYYGLDGDNTGTVLEELFYANSDEKKFRNLSRTITEAIRRISKLIRQSKKNSIIFEAGDDLLFKGYFEYQSLQEMQQIYYDTTGLTCSIGYGKSFQEVYLALKSAKTEPGKNAIVGIELH